MFIKHCSSICCPTFKKSNRRTMVSPKIEIPLPEPVLKRRKSELTLAAVLMIQRWFRRRKALLEMRRKTAWMIYQNIEYAGEQDQLKLHNFFLDLMQAFNVDKPENQVISRVLRRNSTLSDSIEEFHFEKSTAPDTIPVESSYHGPRVQLPIDKSQFESLILAFQRGELLHPHYVLMILHELRRLLKLLPNVNIVSSRHSTCVTVVGDLHGSLADLLLIFHKNGLPSNENPYIFNGDIVDRGFQSIEVFLLISVAFIVYPNHVYLNRGNHEDYVMNLRYGFTKEIIHKYKNYTARLFRVFENVYSWLPIASLVDEQVFVTHGGISDITDLEKINAIKRDKYVSVLNPSFLISDSNDNGQIDISKLPEEALFEWRQILDLLWSDPKPSNGCEANNYRGGGCYWGPDVTKEIMTKHNWTLLIRSHECKEDGFDFTHDRQVLTIFSTSNYYAAGSNRGAFAKILTNQPPVVVQFLCTKTIYKSLTLWERVSHIEEQALQNLSEKFSANKDRLLKEFYRFDSEGKGRISVNDWCDVVSNVLELKLPWRTFKSRLVQIDNEGFVLYQSMFDRHELQCSFLPSMSERRRSLCETIYRNKDLLETVFRAIDKDNSGVISMQEFGDVCRFLSKHNGSVFDDKQIADLASSIDLDKNGVIDFNEFLEAFRMVDVQNRR